ncbi:hypothetical protein Ddc_19169 [Ditylenchus destructor]|nr:hypothetical protein Ddc_19169 [Ditylenchus destructor]
MGKGDNWSPDVHAKWKNQTPCDCGTEHFVSCKIRWIEVPMMSVAEKRNKNVLRWLFGIWTAGLTEVVGAAMVGGFHDLTHECVEVIYNCQKCESEFRRTYEIVDAKTGTSSEWGCYEKIYDSSQSSITNQEGDPSNRQALFGSADNTPVSVSPNTKRQLSVVMERSKKFFTSAPFRGQIGARLVALESPEAADHPKNIRTKI